MESIVENTPLEETFKERINQKKIQVKLIPEIEEERIKVKLIYKSKKSMREDDEILEDEPKKKNNNIDIEDLDDEITSYFKYYSFDSSLTIKDQSLFILLAIFLKQISKRNEVFKKVFLETDTWRDLIEIIPLMSKKSKVSQWRTLTQFFNLISLSFSDMCQFSSRTLDQFQEFVPKKVITEILTLIKQQTQENLRDEDFIFRNLHQLSLSYLCEITCTIIFWSLYVSDNFLKEFENNAGYDIMHILFLSIIRSKGEEDIMIYQRQKLLYILRTVNSFVPHLTKLFQELVILGENKNEKPNIYSSILKPISNQNDFIFPILLGLFENSNMNILNGKYEKGYCLKYEILKILLRILNNYQYQYLEDLQKNRPFKIFKDQFDTISPLMGREILKSFEKYMIIYDKIQNPKALQNKFIKNWVQIIIRDTKDYCQLLEKKNPNSILRVCQHMQSILAFERKDRRNNQDLLRISGLTEVIIKSLVPSMEERNNEITKEILEVTCLYLKDNIENQRTFRSNESMETLYELLYDRDLIEKTLEILQIISANDLKQEFTIINDLTELFGDRRKKTLLPTISKIHQYDFILSTLKKIFLANISSKETFREINGFEKIINILEFLTKKEGGDNDYLIFKVLESSIRTISICVQDNDINRKYFLEKVKYSSILQHLFNLNFITLDTNYGLQLFINLFQLSLSSPELFDEDNLKNNLFSSQRSKDKFIKQIESGVYLFINPEVISEIFIPYISKHIQQIDTSLLQFIFETLFLLITKFTSNRNRLCNIGFNQLILEEFKTIFKNSNHPLQKILINLFLVVGSHHLTTEEVQYFFLFFNTQFPDNLLEILLLFSKKKFTPNYYVDFLPLIYEQSFKGKSQQVSLPKFNITPFPPLKGYTITLWAKIESFGSEYVTENYPKEVFDGVYLFNLNTYDKSLIINAIMTKDMNLSIRIQEESQESLVIFKNFKFQKQKWYFISVQHQYSQTQGKTHQFTLHVNGKEKEKLTHQSKSLSILGRVKNFLNSFPILETVSFGSQYEYSSSIRSSFQIGNVYFFEGSLSNLETYMFYHLGPNYIGHFSEPNLSYYFSNEIVNPWSVSSFSHSIDSIKEGKIPLSQLSERVLFIFSAKGGIVSQRLQEFPSIIEEKNDIYKRGSVYELTSLEELNKMSGSYLTPIEKRSSLGVKKLKDEMTYNFKDPLKISKHEAAQFIPIQSVLIGSVELISSSSFKGNLYAYGGITSILTLLSKMETTNRKVKILQIISFLMKYNNQNTEEMKIINGYEILAHVMKQKNFEQNNSILSAILLMAGLRTPTYNFDEEFSIGFCNKGIICNPFVLEKILLDYQIWKRAPQETQAFLFESILYLVTDHIQVNYHISLFRKLNVLQYILNILQPYYLSDIELTYWSKKLTKITMDILRSIVPSPWLLKDFYPFYKFILSTHPVKGIEISKESEISRVEILKLFYEILKASPDDVIDELHQYINITLVTGLLDHPSSQTRRILLKILFLYYKRRDKIVDFFTRIDGILLITQQLIKYSPELGEVQILFDILLGQDSDNERKRTTMKSSKLNFDIASDSDDEDLAFQLLNTKTEKMSTDIKIEIKPNKKKKRSEIYIDPKILTNEELRIPEILTTIFQIIPHLKGPKLKYNVLEQLQSIFKYGSLRTRNTFINLDTQKYLVECLNQTSIEGETTLLHLILEFLIKYIIFTLENSTKSQNIEYLLVEVLDSFYLLYCYDTVYIQNLQRYILNGILKHYQTTYLLNETSKNFNTKWTMNFSRFCIAAVDHILQWFELPKEVPMAKQKKFERKTLKPSRSFISENSMDSLETQTNLSSNLGLFKTNERNLIMRKISLVEAPKKNDPNMLDLTKLRKNSPKPSKDEEIKEKEETKKKKSFIENGLKAQYWLEEQIPDSESLFQYYHYEISGFVYWLIETIRKLLAIMKKHSVDYTLDLILLKELKRLFLFMVDQQRPFEDISFVLLNLTYSFETGKDKSITNYHMILDFITDEKFIKRFLYKSAIHLLNPKLVILTKSIWTIICQTSKEYLKEIFPLNLLNMSTYDRLFVPGIIDLLTINKEFIHLIFENDLHEMVKIWNESEFKDIQLKLAQIMKQLKTKENKDNEVEKNAKQKLSDASEKLHGLQDKFHKPILAEKVKNQEKELVLARDWNKLQKNLLEDQSILNAYEFKRIIGSENDIYRRESAIEYTTKVWTLCWKLDSTEGPGRVRMKLRRNRILKAPTTTQKQQSIFVDNKLNEELTSEMNDEMKKETFLKTDTLKNNYACTKITPVCKYEGELFIETSSLIFKGEQKSHDNKVSQTPINKKIEILYENIREIHKRRYLLQKCALELFLMNGKTVFFSFNTEKERDKVIGILTGHKHLPNYFEHEEVSDGSSFSLKKSVTKKWQEGLISNFDYLMMVNTSAGRSFNDLTQYPIFPHILADYNSEELDLTDPKTFRDLTKNMGSLNQSRMEKAMEKYESLKEIEKKPYHWGTHYSTRMSVLYYLVRLEPFTRCFWELNGKSLDIPDRTFHSTSKAWELSSGNSHSNSDVKELIPEFFYLHSMFENTNRINFGLMQSQNYVDNVELPPWAKGSSVYFVRKMREALESDYVSKNLHHWIDLIFGYKQQGELAKQAVNLFHPLTYEDFANDIDNIEDPIMRDAIWTQINNFGQTPKQIFKKAHVSRGTIKMNENLIMVSFKEIIDVEKRELKKPVGDVFMSNTNVNILEKNKLFIPTNDVNNLTYISMNWDQTFQIVKWENEKTISIIQDLGNYAEIFLCCTSGSKYFAIGTDTGVVHVYRISKKEGNSSQLLSNFSGHSNLVLCIALSESFGILASGSKDSTVILWDINRMSYYRTIGHNGPVNCVAISPTTGDILTFENESYALNLYTINGELIIKKRMDNIITKMLFSRSDEGVVKNFILIGYESGEILMLDSLNLEKIHSFKSIHHKSPITALHISQTNTDFISGDSNGNVVVWSRKKKKVN